MTHDTQSSTLDGMSCSVHLAYDETCSQCLKGAVKRLYECDCVALPISSKSCHKCGRRGVVSQETWLEYAREMEKLRRERREALERVAILENALRFYAALRDNGDVARDALGVETDLGEDR